MTQLRVAHALLVAAATSVAAACGSSGPAETPSGAGHALVDRASAGRVTGRATLVGTPPPAQTVRVDGDKTCAALVPGSRRQTETYVVGAESGLANVFVYVKTGLERRSFPAPAAPVVLDQRQCWYLPRVVGVQVGQPFQVLNSDTLLHNVRASAVVNEPFNQGQPVQGVRYSHTFSAQEVMVPLSCDVHAWMNAWVGVVTHPYFAVTGADGAFTLPDLPAGTYGIEAWHEAAGLQFGTASVTAQGTATLDLTFTVPAS